jgi:hypothetical protein
MISAKSNSANHFKISNRDKKPLFSAHRATPRGGPLASGHRLPLADFLIANLWRFFVPNPASSL